MHGVWLLKDWLLCHLSPDPEFGNSLGLQMLWYFKSCLICPLLVLGSVCVHWSPSPGDLWQVHERQDDSVPRCVEF